MPVIQSQFVTSGVFRADSYVYVTPEHFQSEIRSKTEPGDVIVAKIGENCGTCAILPEGHEVAIIAGNVLKITTNPEVCLNTFLLYFLKYEYSRNRLIKVKNTTAQPAISLLQLKKLKVPVPPLSEQWQVLGEIEQFEAGKKLVVAAAESSSSLKRDMINTLMP